MSKKTQNLFQNFSRSSGSWVIDQTRKILFCSFYIYEYLCIYLQNVITVIVIVIIYKSYIRQLLSLVLYSIHSWCLYVYGGIFSGMDGTQLMIQLVLHKAPYISAIRILNDQYSVYLWPSGIVCLATSDRLVTAWRDSWKQGETAPGDARISSSVTGSTALYSAPMEHLIWRFEVYKGNMFPWSSEIGGGENNEPTRMDSTIYSLQYRTRLRRRPIKSTSSMEDIVGWCGKMFWSMKGFRSHQTWIRFLRSHLQQETNKFHH